MEDDRIHLIEPEENKVLASEATDRDDLHIHVPSDQYYKRWSPAELAIVANLNSRLTLVQKYTEDQIACRELHLPDRSFRSFRFKLKRLK
ncbi:hypothetical protein DPMN_186051 [Dreissena polymorpha]|uniref:Uncharacterized protein n=1 Tax=Dreissena polymorpha TaxID=45954 RepID=A0A9D4DLN8_DREPO|nr:hypothetical protein DPMN_186051 [Dreissena polymorpha]